jgi:hypothetical protein
VKKERLFSLYRLFSKESRRAHINVFATSSAFYLFLSLVPFVLLLLSLLPYTGLKKENLTEFLLFYAPESFQNLINAIIGEVYTKSFAALSISALIVLWSAAKIMSSLMLGIGEIYDGYRDESILRSKLLAFCTRDSDRIHGAVLIAFRLRESSDKDFRGSAVLGRMWNVVLHLRGVIFIIYLMLYNALLSKPYRSQSYPLLAISPARPSPR